MQWKTILIPQVQSKPQTQTNQLLTLLFLNPGDKNMLNQLNIYVSNIMFNEIEKYYNLRFLKYYNNYTCKFPHMTKTIQSS